MKILGYWMYETTGVLRPAVMAYLHQRPMTPGQIAAMRAYLRHWIKEGPWIGEGIDELRQSIDGLTSRQAIREWLIRALREGIDPL